MRGTQFEEQNTRHRIRETVSPKARSASRHIATAYAERRGARPKLENENLARARPAEGGKPGLSGPVCPVAGADRGQPETVVRLAALAARDGGFGARSGKIGCSCTALRLQNSIRCSAVIVIVCRVGKRSAQNYRTAARLP